MVGWLVGLGLCGWLVGLCGWSVWSVGLCGWHVWSVGLVGQCGRLTCVAGWMFAYVTDMTKVVECDVKPLFNSCGLCGWSVWPVWLECVVGLGGLCGRLAGLGGLCGWHVWSVWVACVVGWAGGLCGWSVWACVARPTLSREHLMRM